MFYEGTRLEAVHFLNNVKAGELVFGVLCLVILPSGSCLWVDLFIIRVDSTFLNLLLLEDQTQLLPLS